MQHQWLFFLILTPLCGAILAYFLGKKIPVLSGIIASGAALISLCCTWQGFRLLESYGSIHLNLFEWFRIGDVPVNFGLQFDQLSALMCLIITGVGSLIHIYSMGYMASDESRPRFFAYLNLFLFSMLVLVLGSNLPVVFVGWEGVGLCSYLLIGFWFKNREFAAAGKKAFIANRIGDAGFLIGTFLLLDMFGTVSFEGLEIALIGSGLTDDFLITIATLCLFLGATGKSAQIPLFVWLPDAMAGPTPVSALIHAATMVTAGVYLLARMHFLFDLAPFTMAVITVIALLTAFIAATTAIRQNDIKKVLAYSTVSQLGFMFLAASTGAYWVALFHVLTHAFFKACLFLGAGSVIHGCHHEQDMTKMGGLARYMPVTFVTYLISTLAIAGIYPFAGYHSKHAILGSLQSNPNPYLSSLNEPIVVFVTVIAALTAFYMTRSLILTFFGKYRGDAHPHESPLLMTGVLAALAALSIGAGSWFHHRLPEFLNPVLHSHAHGGGETALEGLMHSWAGLLGILVAVIAYLLPGKLADQTEEAFPTLSKVFAGKYFFDEFYAFFITGPLKKFSGILWQGVDQRIVDGAVNGTAMLADTSGEVLRVTQSGQTRHYALFLFAATVVVLVFCFLL